MKVNLDWDGCNYFPLNGFHPLFKFLERSASDAATGPASFVVHPYAQKLCEYAGLVNQVRQEVAAIREANTSRPAFAWTWKFFDCEEQFLTELLSEGIYFCHTFPLSLGTRSFIFHLEDVKHLFLPFAVEFDVDVAAANRHAEFEGYRKYIGEILASDKCLAILCHYQATADALTDLFPDFPIAGKIRRLDLASLHREHHEAEAHPVSVKKHRLLFTHSYHGNVASIGARGLGTFLDLCRALAAGDLAGRLTPTLLLPSEYDGEIPDDLGIEVFEGYLPNDVYRSILAETRFHFLSSPWIHTKVLVDCMTQGIIPIFRRHPAYEEYGFSDANSISLCRPGYNALTFYEQKELELKIQVADVLSKVRAFLDASNGGPLHPHGLRRGQEGDAGLASMHELKQFVAGFGEQVTPKPPGLIHGIHERASARHFSMSPRFIVHARFNGLTVLTDRRRYLYTSFGSMPSAIKMADLLRSPRFYRSDKGLPIFDDLTGLRAALRWRTNASPTEGLAAMLKYWLSRHRQLYLLARAIYSVLRRLRNRLARLRG